MTRANNRAAHAVLGKFSCSSNCTFFKEQTHTYSFFKTVPGTEMLLYLLHLHSVLPDILLKLVESLLRVGVVRIARGCDVTEISRTTKSHGHALLVTQTPSNMRRCRNMGMPGFTRGTISDRSLVVYCASS
jgi:hypothetical protein